MSIDFRNQLKQITFTTFHRDQLKTVGFDELFNNRRVIVFSLTQIYTRTSLLHVKNFNNMYESFTQLGIDNVYVVDSTDRLIAPWANIHATNLMALPDSDMKFVECVSTYANVNKPIFDLARTWQYALILNNGMPEKLWNNSVNTKLPLTITKSFRYRYRGVGGDVVQQYLIDNPK